MRSKQIQIVLLLIAGACYWSTAAQAEGQPLRENYRAARPFSVRQPSAVARSRQASQFSDGVEHAAHETPAAFPRQIPAKKITKPSGSFSLTAPQPKKGNSSSRSSTGSLWTTLGSLALIVGLILVVAKLFKKHSPVASQALPSEAVELLGRRPLDARQSIHLIRLGSRILLIGTSPEGMQTLSEITDPLEVDYLAGMCRKTDEQSPFSNAFQSFFTRQSKSQTGQQHTPAAREVAPNQEIIDQFNLRVTADPESSRKQAHG